MSGIFRKVGLEKETEKKKNGRKTRLIKHSLNILVCFLVSVTILLLCSTSVQASWTKKGNYWYYHTQSGRLLKSRWVDSRYVNEKGKWVKAFLQTQKGIRFRLPDGHYVKAFWKTIDGSRYYFNSSGYMVTDRWIQGKYLQTDGRYLKGLIKTRSGICYKEADGSYARNKWKTVNAARFYFGKNGYAVKGKRVTIRGIRYTFDKNGAMRPGLRVSAKGTRYQNTDGTYLKGQWKKLSGKWKYFEKDGYQAKARWVGDYYVDKKGSMAVSTWIGSKFVGADGKKTAPSALSLSAKSAFLIDAATGKTIYRKNGDLRLSNASTTKIMTAILALENSGLEDTVYVSSYAAAQEEVKLYMQAGEGYKMRDLLYALLLPSYNDVAVAIAEHVGGSVNHFAAMMNQKAREIGCTSTSFVTPNGLDDPDYNHRTTASDLAKMARYALKIPMFRQIAGTRSYSFACPTSGRNFYVETTDKFLDQMQGAIGVKTGFTSAAGYCFVGAIERNGRTYISVVLGCPNDSLKWSDTQKLMSYGLSNYP